MSRRGFYSTSPVFDVSRFAMGRDSPASWIPGATSWPIFPLIRRNYRVLSWCPIWGGTMFFRAKTSGPRTYLQVVENRWEGGRSRQRVVATLGRLDQLQQNGQLDGLLASGARLARSVLLLSEHAQGRLPTISIRHIGPALVFQRLWQLTDCQHVIQQLLKSRRIEFPLERA